MMSENGHIRIFGLDLSATDPLTLSTPERELGWSRSESARETDVGHVSRMCWAR
jgi:hypothetical protein